MVVNDVGVMAGVEMCVDDDMVMVMVMIDARRMLPDILTWLKLKKKKRVTKQ